MSAIEITGEAGVHKMLAGYTNPLLTKRLQAATSAGAKALKKPVQTEAKRASKRLAKSVSARTAKRDKPAAVVTFRPKVAFFRHFVIGGTRDHGPRKAGNRFLIFRGRSGQNVMVPRVRGVKPNPIIARVVAAYEREAYAAIDNSLTKSET